MKIIKDSRKSIELKAAILIAKKIRQYTKTQDSVVLAIPGGSSVSGIFKLLLKEKIPWKKVHIFMVDERLVPSSHPDSNFLQAKTDFLDYLTENYILPKENLHPYIYFNLESSKGTRAYKNELREYSHKFDISLLSAGEDGHIASLYPQHSTIKTTTDFFIITKTSPKPPASRVSASRKLLERSKTALLLFLGESKRQAFNNFNNKLLSVNDCPAKLINKIEDSYVFTDII